MSTVQTWTLWQRLPPRYQLTSRSVEEDELITIATDRSQPSLKLHSGSNSRPTSGRLSPTPRQQVAAAPAAPATDRDFMLQSNVPESVQTQISQSIKQVPQVRPFPQRKSDYINHFKTQKRVNSARRRLAETPPTSSPAVSQAVPDSDASRATTAPAFPVTNPATHSGRRTKVGDTSLSDKQQAASSVNSVGNTQPRPRIAKEPTKVDVFQFDDSKSMSTSSSMKQERDIKPKKYQIQDTKKATMFIDNGKVIYFGKSRHDLSPLLKTQSLRKDRSNCFLADLRRDYLKHPKYETRMSKRSESDPRRIASERVDYNRKVEHILNYYSDNIESQYSRPDSGYRATTPRGSRRKGLSLTVGAPSRPPSRANSPIPERPDTPGDFIRLNRQSKLHERHFYLRTPGLKHEKTIAELERCRCSMCRIELQLALVTGMSHTLGLGTTQLANAEIKQTNGQCTAKNGEKVKSVNINIEEVDDNSKIKEKSSNGQRVTFTSKELSPRAQEHTLTISCTLPEMEEMAVSESGIESARTHDVESTIPDEISVVQ